jgi:hypothetical protein
MIRPNLFSNRIGAFTLMLAVAPATWALGPVEMADLKARIDQDMTEDLPKSYADTIDVRTIPSEWKANPARATIKFTKVNGYRGILKRIAIRNNSDADLVFATENGGEITAFLFPWQLGPWEKRADGKMVPKGGLTTLQFAALYEPGQEFYLQCKEANPAQLINCLAMPAEVPKSRE